MVRFNSSSFAISNSFGDIVDTFLALTISEREEGQQGLNGQAGCREFMVQLILNSEAAPAFLRLRLLFRTHRMLFIRAVYLGCAAWREGCAGTIGNDAIFKFLNGCGVLRAPLILIIGVGYRR
jgi:hypothetical protein